MVEKSDDKELRKKKVSVVKTYTVALNSKEIKENFILASTNSSDLSREELINKAFNFHSNGNNLEAAKYYKYFIDKGFNDHRVFSNYGVILKNFGKLEEHFFQSSREIWGNRGPSFSTVL